MDNNQPVGLKLGNRPAFPSKFTYGDKDEFGAPVITERVSYGLTRREWLAGMALQGLLASCKNHPSLDDLARDAILAADKLLENLKG